MDNITQIFGTELAEHLRDKAHFNEGQIDACMSKFHQIAEKASPDLAFKTIYNAYGADNKAEQACASIRAVIQAALEKVNASHPGVETNPLKRLRALIKRFNANVDKCGVESLELTNAEKEQIHFKVPSVFAFLDKATASEYKNENGLALVVRI